MNPETFKEALALHGILLTPTQMNQFERYFELLVEWNQKINLTAITEKNDVYLKHFYDSIAASFYEDFSTKAYQLCDVGAGAGFPSIPLKIIYPQLKVTIIDSLNKRIQFLDLLAKELGLEDVSFYHSRAEDFGQNKAFRETFDIVTARAVARMSVLSELCIPLVKKDGRFIALKASNSVEEMSDAKKAIALLGGKQLSDHVFQLSPEAGERHIISIRKTKETPNKYPRKPGLPNKKPL